MAAHRYWRWLITQTRIPSNLFTIIYEAELMTGVGGADQTGSGTANASSYSSSTYMADKAFDNNTSGASGTYWASNSLGSPHWLSYDFGAGQEKDIVQYTLVCDEFHWSPENWYFQYSDNNINWVTVDSRIGYRWDSRYLRSFIVGDDTIYSRVTPSAIKRDMEDCGNLSIIERVTLINAPIVRRVRLCDQISGRVVRESWSDQDGYVIFENLREGPWILYALDHENEFQSVIIEDRIATEDGYRP